MSAPFLQNQYAFAFPSLMECSRPYSEPAAFDFQSCNTTNKTDDPHVDCGVRDCCTISMISWVIGSGETSRNFRQVLQMTVALVALMVKYLESVPKMRFSRATHIARFRIAGICELKLDLQML